MDNRGSTGIQIQGGSDCHIDNCEFSGLGTAVDIEGGERNRVTRSRFWRNQTDVRVRGGVGHAIVDSIFDGKRRSNRKDGLEAIRQYFSLSDKMPDREILASLHAVLRERNENGKRDAATKSSLGRWLMDHGSDVNTAVNTVVTLAAAVAQWFK